MIQNAIHWLVDWYNRRTPHQMLAGVIALIFAYQFLTMYFEDPHKMIGDCYVDWDGRSNPEVCD